MIGLGDSDGYEQKGTAMEERTCICKECEKEFPRSEMTFSHDCHGIPFRLLCFGCLDKVYSEKGYDGEYYTEADECIDCDY